MGDFSRDPNIRLDDSIAKHYVGVRLQQGVPILDTDWNELEDLRRHELASLFTEYIGDGVPGGNDGFRIDALANGGVGTIVLTAVHQPASPSSMTVDFGASTAVSALGFLPGTFDGHPARVTGLLAGPFQLTAGNTLTVVVNGEAETATFQAADFTDIRAATAAEVVAVLNVALSRASASIGAGGDFLIRGGDGTVAGAGRLMASGKEVLAESTLLYSSQRLFQDEALSQEWDVPALRPLNAPAGADRVDTVYIDIWDREVSAAEDDAFLLAAVGVEATLRVRREWVVRVAEGAEDLSGIARQPRHTYLALARLRRATGDGNALPATSIEDQRKRQLTLSDVVISPILVKGEHNLDRVNSALFATMLSSASRVYGELLSSDYFLASNFSNITAVESVLVLRAFQDVRFLAESGVTEASLRRFDNVAALAFMRRLYDVQRVLVDALMVLADDGSVQRLPTRDLLQELDVWLEGDGGGIPGLRRAVLPTESPGIGEAYDAQIFINSQLGVRVGVLPHGLLNIQFVSAPPGAINAGSVHVLVYSITSVLNADDTLVLALADTASVFDFAFQDLPEDPGSPGDASRALLSLEQGDTAFVSFELVVPASVPNGTPSRLVLTAVSQTNPEEIDFANVAILVEVGAAIQQPSPQVGLTLQAPLINLAADVVEIGSAGDAVTFQVEATNLGAGTAEFQFSVEAVGHPDSYEVVNTSVLNPANLPAGVPQSVGITVQATTDAVAGEGESLMVIRLTRTADGAFQELHIRVVPNVGP